MSEEAQPVKILVVDDDPVNLMLTCQTLTGEGFSTKRQTAASRP